MTHNIDNVIMDHLSETARSELMSKIGSKHTQPEITLRKMLWAAGYRYRLHDKTLPGTPDIIFKSKKSVIFLHGCFWHGHDCRNNLKPKSRSEYWGPKLARNKERDEINMEKLTDMGWKTLVIWECELKTDQVLRKITEFLNAI